MLLVFFGFIAATSIAFGMPFLMGGNDNAVAAKRGITVASVTAFVYVSGVALWRGLA